MHVAIDPDKCEGHARCWDLCPQVFDIDESGYGVVVTPDVPAELEGKTKEAAMNCPERAIIVT